MDKLLISGRASLKGEIKISGAKNAALPIMASTLLAPGVHTLKRIPRLRDVFTMTELIRRMGGSVHFDGVCIIDTTKINKFEASYDLVKTMRASILVLGPLVARFGKAKVSLPGGCAIGARPVNLHIRGLEKMGAKISLEEGYIFATARNLKGTKIYFDIPTVTGTENLMMAATLAKGTTVIENAAKEPEIVDLANYLIEMGAKIKGAGTSILTIEGVPELKPPSEYEIIPDRIETGTFIAIAGACGADIVLQGCRIDHIDAIILKMKDAGITFKETENGLRVIGSRRPQAVDVKTMPYPGFPTDMQAQFMAMMTIANGTSIIKETIFENRFMHVAELKRMGANITIEGNTATVRGVKKLKGAPVMATDLRASASLVIAGLIAEEETIIDRIYHLDRGYEELDKKLIKLGAKIKRIK
ncbi:MAG TPA: UDP-N-acetylglucosamine 1-carboxyvinyltransferase [Thermodesulfovibrio thiophilus]|uniref:UDP-N-acetylglucosamine 1-carboxyvinyltransferase n=1 Tax=Thermodesulfovibrio thiophilus TaxID=340095 RepID=UPI00048C0775|nr:UDP-N-acetylglucosamine 1-carboxyvinyltransferase [Thermodesulfovibrio thiophilus]HHW19951.1 UDP-N-acetylglucosamine 1-carboxyvinyltransferase [Thermodesulfovibrio thiophilus]HQA03442.1 UDP-N-acetylglucosamine 1-carboxyvinyltransferase [Thermodesulfovibrio thiophilus]HQD35922.1 UDP-N-acetylglucosamine 1-carboxyvinyltransferase [Thermodesulfovibrio thiophilus]